MSSDSDSVQRLVRSASARPATGTAARTLVERRQGRPVDSARSKVVSLLYLVRIHAGLTAAAMALVATMLTGADLQPSVVALVVAAVLFTTSAGNALNDVYDDEIDSLNRPGRPIPAGRISRKTAIALAAALFVAAIAASASISGWCLAIGLNNVVLLIIYAKHSKTLGIVKNILVGALVGSVVLFSATEFRLVNGLIAVLCACAALGTVAREIIKDIEDKAGDTRCGARTLPIATGDGFAYSTAYACLAAEVALAFIPYFAAGLRDEYAALVALGGMIFLASLLATRARTRQSIVMAGSVVHLAAFYLGRI